MQEVDSVLSYIIYAIVFAVFIYIVLKIKNRKKREYKKEIIDSLLELRYVAELKVLPLDSIKSKFYDYIKGRKLELDEFQSKRVEEEFSDMFAGFEPELPVAFEEQLKLQLSNLSKVDLKSKENIQNKKSIFEVVEILQKEKSRVVLSKADYQYILLDIDDLLIKLSKEVGLFSYLRVKFNSKQGENRLEEKFDFIFENFYIGFEQTSF